MKHFSAPADLREFLAVLRREGELVEVSAPVSTDQEVAEIHRRVIAAGGPALLFTSVQGSKWPLVTNLFGSKKRVELAFGSRPLEMIEGVARLAHELPPTPKKLWDQRKLLGSLLKVGTKERLAGLVACNHVTPPNLHDLPALKTWPRDGGSFITLPLVYTQHPETGVPNLGMYRAQVFDETSCGVHIQIQRGGGFHLSQAEALGRALPVNLMVGGPPALMLGAIAPLPENIPELLLTSLVLGKKLQMTTNPVGPLPIVNTAEFCLVGEIEPGARRPEGPFGDHYGYYSETHDFPWMRVKTLLHRDDAIYPATVVGKPRQEDFFIGDYLQELLSPLFPLVMPSVTSLWSYGETGYHSLSAAIVRESYRREALVSAFRILGEGQLSLTKFLLLTDGAVDLRDFRATLEYVLARTDLRTDLFVLANLSMDTLDYAGPKLNEGSKGILMGIGDPIRELRSSFEGTPPTGVRAIEVFCPGCLVVEIDSHESAPDAARELVRSEAFSEWPLIVFTDDAKRAARSSMNFLWTTFTRFDPASDITCSEQQIVANHVSFTGPMAIDARMKVSYPEELSCAPEAAKTVSERWKEYFPAGLEMGDSERGHLD